MISEKNQTESVEKGKWLELLMDGGLLPEEPIIAGTWTGQ